MLLGIATTLGETRGGTAKLGAAQGVLRGGRRQRMSPTWEHPGPLCPDGGSWAAASAAGGGDKGTLSLPSTELVAGTAAPGQEIPFAAPFAPGEGIQAMQLELLTRVKTFASLQQERRGDPPVVLPRSRLVTLEMALRSPRREGLCAAAPQRTLVQSGPVGRAAAALNGRLCLPKNAWPRLAARCPPPSADPFSSHAVVGRRRRSKRQCWGGSCAGARPAAGVGVLQGGQPSCAAEPRVAGEVMLRLAGTEGALLGLPCPLVCVCVQRGGDPKSWSQALHHFRWERQP